MTHETMLDALAEGAIGFAEEGTPEWITVRDMAIELIGYRQAEKRIREWRDGAYPLNFAGGIFDEPDMQDVTRKLGKDDLTKLSASNFRHVLTCVIRFFDESRPTPEVGSTKEEQGERARRVSM